SDQTPDEQSADSQPLLPGAYRLSERQQSETFFSLRSDPPSSGQPLEITEVFYSNPQQAVNDLLRGSIDVLDQLYPADAKRLANQPGVRVGSYALPSTHMLVPVSEHAYLANAKFRRALLVSTDRQSLLTRELLGGDDPADGRLISGPFPMGRGADDPLAYAYNNSVPPIATNPDLAKLLLAMSRNEVAESAKRNGEAKPALEKLVVGCPDYSLARVAVEALIEQWSAIGIEAEVLVLNSEESLSAPVDLVYTMATIWEPATDVQRLLGPGGIASTDNPFIVQALGTLRVARNWREVRSALQDLHQLIDYHLPVLPLWQISDRFAVLQSLEGWHDKPMSLYQDVSAWRFQDGP
ncbi:MAG: ABC transporter substrate-binding protein, partial [Aureliella sp.]